MTLCFSIRSSLSFSVSCSPNGTLRSGSFTCTVSCSITMCYGSSKQPSPLHTSLYVLLILSVVTASTPFTPLVINPRFSHIESPEIGGDFELTM